MSESKSISPNPQGREPKAGEAPLPLWAVTLVGVFAFVGIARLVETAGGFDPNVNGPYTDLAKVQTVHPPPNIPAIVIEGKKLFAKNCASCHQANGLGLPPLFPPVAGSDWVTVEGSGRLVRIVLHGLQGPITVNGKEYNNNMIAWKDSMSDQEVAAVVSYIRNDWGNKGSLVSAEEVKEIRAKESGRTEQWTAAELLAIPLQ
jgi:mono/diheme cytochrome c family protein